MTALDTSNTIINPFVLKNSKILKRTLKKRLPKQQLFKWFMKNEFIVYIWMAKVIIVAEWNFKPSQY